MSQHPTLKIDSVGAKHRNVLSRLERIKRLQDDNKWHDRSSAFNLPKIKSLKVKVKKVKEVKAGAEAGATAGKPAAVAAPAAAAKSTAAKPAAGKAAGGDKGAKGK
jgi:small basic protein (TIGR04137 family)